MRSGGINSVNHDRLTLVIGYGNTLRGDDGVGPRAAGAVHSWNRPGVSALSVAQLTPELASLLAAVRLAVFVDARPGNGDTCRGVEVHAIEPASAALRAFSHAGDPSGLLALAREVHGTYPRAWLVTVPSADLGFGEGLSPRASLGLEVALQRIDELLS